MATGSRFSDGDIKMPDINLSNLNSKHVMIAFAVLAVIWLLTGIYFVGPQEAGVVKRFGKVVSQVEPGPHYHLPWPFETVDKPKVKEQKRLEIGFRTVAVSPSPQYRSVAAERTMLTSDENMVDVDIIVQYLISDPVKYLYRIKDQDATIKNASEAAIRHVIGQNKIDDALTDNKTGIQNETQIKLQEILDGYDSGILVTTVKMQDVQPPVEVADAFRDVASAIQDKDRLINQAQGYANEVIPKARGDAERVIREAEGYKEERIKRAQGDIDRFLAVLAEYRNAKDVTRKRLYIEAMEQILPGIDKYIIQSDGSGGLFNLLQLGKPGGK